MSLFGPQNEMQDFGNDEEYDDMTSVQGDKWRRISGRESHDKMLQTGISAIDMFCPIALG
jgi:F0F1-type ATP synthase alpha subunit